MNATSDLIRRIRKRGLSQSEISRRTGIPQPRLSRWENAAEGGAADDVLKLAALDAELASGSSAAFTASAVQTAHQDAV